MHIVKKIEIIANALELAKILESFENTGIYSHVVIRNVAGKGLQGFSEDLDMTMLDNVYILAFCMPDDIKPAVESIRAVLNKFGGSCYISEVMEIRSVRCVASL
ncbi:MAG: P-II family nitrogen regulator [Pegethrix bostrychoides GSE-TBD4-15B]|jgi:nitrogen regulatory protein PII|uniref:P-II family nitrogen regulator n=1 Tax=Pegethrix bostrychoides GSE-TBD4-15B TaxID=2839662 RepID=A0A951U6S8_9CYAN|nr:P-II family nitrogen regulator [Pegethrix bostrychoides GSE-TBD4-15B]